MPKRSPATLSMEELAPDDVAPVESLLADPSLSEEFDRHRSASGASMLLNDPHALPGLSWLARVDGEPAGLVVALVLAGQECRWSMLRLGVVERHRRMGVGTRLLQIVTEEMARVASDVREVLLSAWIPNDAAAAFAGRHGYAHARYFWMMERPRSAVPDFDWPEGTTVRRFDGSDEAFEDWNEVFNASFAGHYRMVRSTVARCRALAAQRDTEREGLLLAYRGGRCVGFCRCELHADRGEVATLGVAPEARGRGLGRALLRWGVQRLEAADAKRITLLVDGENPSALALYRAEGFTIARTRELWGRELVR